jgi:hypothetical protein
MVDVRRTKVNFGDDGYDVDRMLRFVVSAKSQFYPQIGTLYGPREVSSL